ncbi:Pyrazinamidase/nicotinamidase [Grifola frondosa]|uniref:Pyrazinamidase/nicotinamidase n=1 Tax=Grifola frondosa TaxID=5627 RepID=A0A1C7LZF8_GRIFR|nr:Pyrazinamidase/nicotinamidase [Grifola frondosa]
MPPEPFRPALLLVDIQEDFCPPDGALAVPDGRAVIPIANALLQLPFALKLASKDHHPPAHISFASRHPGASPFVSSTTIANPANPAETYTTRLWPDHCVAGTRGNALVPALDAARVDRVVLKGTDARVEAYSAFGPPLRDPPLVEAESALGASRVEGVCGGGGRAMRGGAEGWAGAVEEMERAGVRVVRMDGEEVGWVRALDG